VGKKGKAGKSLTISLKEKIAGNEKQLIKTEIRTAQ